MKDEENKDSKSSIGEDSDKETPDSIFIKSCELTNIHPQWNTFKIDSWTISSDFDSGNLMKAYKGKDGWINLEISPDGAPYGTSNQYSWFYFKLAEVPP